MVSRLVLGCSPVGQRLVEGIHDGPGTVTVVTEDEDRVEALRDETIRAELADPAAPESLARVDSADVVVVAADEPWRSRRIADIVRERSPTVTLLVYVSPEATDEERRAIARSADRVIDARSVLADRVADLVASRASDQARRLRSTLRSVEGTLAVVMHDNPDPDAIASAVALVRVAAVVGVEAVPCYYGNINHQENRALVNLLDLDLRNLTTEDDLSEFGGFALVDHSRPGVNDRLPEDVDVDVVIDHHPPRAPVEASFVDLRSEVGATSTLLTTYLRRFGVDDYGGSTVATALLYGIRIDTKDFSREVATADFEAAAELLPHADGSVLDRVETPDHSPETLDVLARAIRNREVDGRVLATCVGPISDRDTLAQAADRLLDMDGITATLVYGYDEDDPVDGGTDGDEPAETGMLYASARARGTPLDLGETLRVAFDTYGSAGGHADMAGAQIPLSRLTSGFPDEDDVNQETVRQVVSGTFFEAVRERPHERPRRGPKSIDELESRYLPEEAPDPEGRSGTPETEE
ncbi:DHH family phosphoesterase [Halobacteriales archaeon QS_8_69_26]|nr:MAG: DHH family phosphoesterase [Halobacteriales archaeon QS_8_69_26]